MLSKLKNYNFLFSELVKRDFQKKYKRTTLGMAWSIIAPLLQLVVMKLVFTQFFGRTTEHYTIYLFAGNLIFTFFKESTDNGMTSLIENASIFTKVNIPKYLFLLSKNVSSLINFALTMVLFFTFVAIDGIPFTWKFITLLYPTVILVIFNIGVGLILSAVYVMFRDIKYLYGIFTMLLMYMSAIFYTIDSYPEKAQLLFLLNPVYLCIRYYRKVVLENAIPSIYFHLIMAAYAFGSLAIGLLVYKKMNHKFVYYV